MKFGIAFLLVLSASLCADSGIAEPGRPVMDGELLVSCYNLWKDSGFGKDPNRTERSAWILLQPSGKYVLLRWPKSGERNKERWIGPLPDGVVGQVHTHTVMVDPKPAKQDLALAIRLSISLYTISGSGIWMADPKGIVGRIRGPEWYKDLQSAQESEQKEIQH